MSKAILFDSSRCSACKGCQVACKAWNDLPSPLELNSQKCTGSYQAPADLNGDTRLIITFDEKKGGSKGVEWAFGRRSCMHCEEPACVDVCPSGALYKDEETGFVVFDEEKCTGCQYCRSACPFDVPRHHGIDTKINKCTGCIDRIKEGRSPACVQTCQPGALKFGDRDELLKEAKERVKVLQSRGLDKAVLYGEEEMGGLHVIVIAKYGIAAMGLPENPKNNNLLNMVHLLRPATGLVAAAVAAGLGLSFLTGIGYRRDKLRYDEEAHELIDDDTKEVIKRYDDTKEEK